MSYHLFAETGCSDRPAPCRECGKVVWTMARSADMVLCGDCKAEHARLRSWRYAERQRAKKRVAAAARMPIPDVLEARQGDGAGSRGVSGRGKGQNEAL